MFKRSLFILCFIIGSSMGFCLPARTFSSNHLSEEDKSILREFIQDFANESMETLMQKKESLESFLDRFKDTNPLTISAFFFSEAELRESARKIMRTDGKSYLFTFSLAMQIDQSTQNGSLDYYVSEIANSLDLDRDLIHNLIRTQRYKDLVYYILQM